MLARKLTSTLLAVIDATSGPESMWLMSAGFPEAWKEVPERVRL
jgi:hypothetical protein